MLASPRTFYWTNDYRRSFKYRGNFSGGSVREVPIEDLVLVTRKGIVGFWYRPHCWGFYSPFIYFNYPAELPRLLDPPFYSSFESFLRILLFELFCCLLRSSGAFLFLSVFPICRPLIILFGSLSLLLTSYFPVFFSFGGSPPSDPFFYFSSSFQEASFGFSLL